MSRHGVYSPAIEDPRNPGNSVITGEWNIFSECEWLSCEIKNKSVANSQNIRDGDKFQAIKFPLTTEESLNSLSGPKINDMIRETPLSGDVIYTFIFDLSIKKVGARPKKVGGLVGGRYKIYKKTYFILPVSGDLLTINGQEALNTQLGQKWRKGRFEYTFKQLNELTKDNQDASLTSNWKDLNNKQYLKNLKFELFGIEMPSKFIGTWGLTILLSIQIYFFCHLYYLYCNCKLKNKIELNFPWIGIYPYSLPKLFYIISLSLPTITHIVVAIRTLQLGISTLYVWLFLSISIIVSLFTFITTRKIWRLPVVPAGDTSVR
jgi:hypothetical protein